jgi:hypothetical protein
MDFLSIVLESRGESEMVPIKKIVFDHVCSEIFRINLNFLYIFCDDHL